MNERCIDAFYYAIGGIFFGIMLAIAWSFYISTQTNSVLIILVTTCISALLGFLFPQSIPHIFKACWNFLK